MIIKREFFEGQELSSLAPYAVKSAESRGRSFFEKEDEYRTCFQRDRDRIIHCKAFRRLNGKTQVFIAGYGDHYRSRLTHSMEVAQFARDLARMLNLNQDLAEAIALAHDLGHTPFGHAGQEAMHAIMQQYGGRFEHNEQSFRVVHALEQKSDDYQGLNLSFEVLDGLLKHRTEYDRPEAFDHFMPSLEAQIVNVADEIAYQSHDIDDGLRSGILKPEHMAHLKIWERVADSIPSSAIQEIQFHHIVTAIMSLLVNDLGHTTVHTVSQLGAQTVRDIYHHPEALACFSDEVDEMAAELRSYLHENFYNAKEVMQYNEKGKEIITELFRRLYDRPELLPQKYQTKLDQEDKHIVVKDYIAGMTDSFAMDYYNEILR